MVVYGGGVCIKMTVTYIGSGIYVGVNSDTKPTTGVATNALFIETDTGEINKYNGSSWDLLVPKEAITTKTANYTLTTLDKLVFANAASGGFTLTLPTAASGNGGRIFRIRKIDSTYNIVIIDGNGSQTIDGMLNWELRNPGDYIHIISDGANWHTISYTDPTIHSFRRKGTTEDRWYIGGMMTGGNMSASTLTFDNLNATPFMISTPMTLNDMAVNVTTSAASSTVRLGVYRDANLYPSTLVVEAGEVATATDNTFASVTLGTPVILQPGLYWFAVVAGTASPTVRFVVNTQNTNILGNRSNAGDVAAQVGWVHAYTYAALPATFPNSSPATTTTNRPAIYARFI